MKTVKKRCNTTLQTLYHNARLHRNDNSTTTDKPTNPASQTSPPIHYLTQKSFRSRVHIQLRQRARVATSQLVKLLPARKKPGPSGSRTFPHAAMIVAALVGRRLAAFPARVSGPRRHRRPLYKSIRGALISPRAARLRAQLTSRCGGAGHGRAALRRGRALIVSI